jgi:hypothetical protein
MNDQLDFGWAVLGGLVLGFIIGVAMFGDRVSNEQLIREGNGEYDRITGKFRTIPHLSATSAVCESPTPTTPPNIGN